MASETGKSNTDSSVGKGVVLSSLSGSDEVFVIHPFVVDPNKIASGGGDADKDASNTPTEKAELVPQFMVVNTTFQKSKAGYDSRCVDFDRQEQVVCENVNHNKIVIRPVETEDLWTKTYDKDKEKNKDEEGKDRSSSSKEESSKKKVTMDLSKNRTKNFPCAHSGCYQKEFDETGQKGLLRFYDTCSSQYIRASSNKSQLQDGKARSSMRVCENHLRFYKDKDTNKKFNCKACRMELSCYGDFYRHLPPHGVKCPNQSRDKRKCYYCDKWYDSGKLVMAHTRKHIPDLPFRCFCGAMFEKRTDRANHMDFVHYKNTPEAMNMVFKIKTEPGLEASKSKLSDLVDLPPTKPLKMRLKKIGRKTVTETRSYKKDGKFRRRVVVWKRCKNTCVRYFRAHDGKTTCGACSGQRDRKSSSEMKSTSFSSSKKFKTPAIIASSDSDSDTEARNRERSRQKSPQPAKIPPRRASPIRASFSSSDGGSPVRTTSPLRRLSASSSDMDLPASRKKSSTFNKLAIASSSEDETDSRKASTSSNSLFKLPFLNLSEKSGSKDLAEKSKVDDRKRPFKHDSRCKPVKLKLQRIGRMVNYRLKSGHSGGMTETWKRCPVCACYQVTASQSSSSKCCRSCKERLDKLNRDKIREVAEIDSDSDSEDERSRHFARMRLRCEECYKRFHNYGEYYHHKWMHMKRRGSNRSVKCPVCRAPQATAQNIIEHLPQHTSSRAFGCKKCRKGWRNQADYKEHSCSKKHFPDSGSSDEEERVIKICKKIARKSRKSKHDAKHLKYNTMNIKKERRSPSREDERYRKDKIKVKTERRDDWDADSRASSSRVKALISSDEDDDMSRRPPSKRDQPHKRKEVALPLKDSGKKIKKENTRLTELREKRKQAEKRRRIEDYDDDEFDNEDAKDGVVERSFSVMADVMEMGKIKKIDRRPRPSDAQDLLGDNVMVVKETSNSYGVTASDAPDKRSYPPIRRGASGLEEITEAYWQAVICHTLPRMFKNIDHRKKDLEDMRVKELPNYSCFMCDKTFVSYGFYLVHLNHHLKLSSFKLSEFFWACPFCKASFTTSAELISHLSDAGHVDFKPFQCGEVGCDFTCGDLSDLNEHNSIHHPGGDPNNPFDKPAPSTASIIQVADVGDADPRSKMFNHLCKMQLSALNDVSTRTLMLPCDICGTTSNCYGDFLYHMDLHDDPDLSKRCVFCKFEHQTMEGIIDHYNTTHNKAFPSQPFKCNSCVADFGSSILRDEHVLTCTKAPYIADEANKIIFIVSGEKISAMPDEYKCKACKHVANCYGDWFMHIWKHYEEEDRALQSLKCPICKNESANAQNLVWHFLSHADDERPFKCPYYDRCGVGFNSSKLRDAHIRVCERDQISFLYSQVTYNF